MKIKFGVKPVDKDQISIVKRYEADILSISPLSEQILHWQRANAWNLTLINLSYSKFYCFTPQPKCHYGFCWNKSFILGEKPWTRLRLTEIHPTSQEWKRWKARLMIVLPSKLPPEVLRPSFVWRKVVPGKRVTLPAISLLVSVYMRK